MSEGITRRQALKGAGAAGLGLSALGGIDGLLAAAADAARPGRHGSLADIEHVVILIQENRSFDHYFGTLSGVRGFGSAPRSAFDAAGQGRQDAGPVPPAQRVHLRHHPRVGCRSTAPGTAGG